MNEQGSIGPTTVTAPTSPTDGVEESGDVSVENVSVAYPGGKALSDVTLTFKLGRVHVLAGENGAGKSTLIKVLAGSRLPDVGRVLVSDTEMHLANPASAASAGIGALHQELQLFPLRRVWENVSAASFAVGPAIVEERLLRARAVEAMRRVGADFSPDVRADSLSPGQQQLIAIATALVREARFLIFDEPTANLSRPERDRLLGVIRDLASQGVGVVFVSHHLDEALAVGDDVTVLRDGRVVWTKVRRQVTKELLVEAMFGGAAESPAASSLSPGTVERRLLLDVRGLRWGRAIPSLDLEVFSGEVVAIAGLPGSDAETLLRAIAGGLPYDGQVTVGGRPLPKTIHGAISAGQLGFVPADRKADGLFPDLSVIANVCAASLSKLSRFGFVRDAACTAVTKEMVRRLRIQPSDPRRRVGTMSGGNQQKTLVARWLSTGVRILLADEPTRGVDIATKLEIHHLLRELASDGGACLVYSSDLDELAVVADRVLVLRRDGSWAFAPPRVPADRLFEMMSGARAA